jgi:hypothetical protein
MQFDLKSALIGFLVAVLLYFIFFKRVSGMVSGPDSFSKARGDSCPDGYDAATEFLCVKKK